MLSLASGFEPAPAFLEDRYRHREKADRPHELTNDLQSQKQGFRLEVVLFVFSPYTDQDVGGLFMSVTTL